MMKEKLKYREENFKCGFLIDIDAITGEQIICENFTASLMALNDHQNSHMGYKPYKCDQCPMTFTSYNRRFTHIKEVHKLVQDTPNIKTEGVDKIIVHTKPSAEFKCTFVVEVKDNQGQ